MRTVKKVVIICPYLFELHRGIERYCLSLADALVEKGIKVIIYCWVSSGNGACGEINRKIKIRKVPNRRYYRDRIASLFYKLWLRIDNPDVTVLNFLYHGEEYLPADRPYCYVLHSPASQIPSRYEYVSKKLPRFSKLHVIAISKMVEDEARPYIGGKPMTLVYNGTDTEKFRPDTKAGSAKGKLRIISAAAFEERKGLHLMIEALGKLEERDRITYDIYGGGNADYERRLDSLIKGQGLEKVVSLKGSVSNIADIMPGYDLFALPSKGEAFALSPIEAMACGLPILVSDCPPYPEFVTPDFGFMADRDNPGDIRDIISALLANPERLAQMKRASRQAALAYSWKKVVEKYLEVMNTLYTGF